MQHVNLQRLVVRSEKSKILARKLSNRILELGIYLSICCVVYCFGSPPAGQSAVNSGPNRAVELQSTNMGLDWFTV